MKKLIIFGLFPVLTLSVLLIFTVSDKTMAATKIDVNSTASVREVRYTSPSPFALNIAGVSSASVNVDFSTTGQCAIRFEGYDNYSTNSNIVFPAGEISIIGYVIAIDDEIPENLHYCTVSFNSTSTDDDFNNLTGTMLVSITDDDATNHTIIAKKFNDNLPEGVRIGSESNGFFTVDFADQPSADATITATTDNTQCHFYIHPHYFYSGSRDVFDNGGKKAGSYTSTLKFTIFRDGLKKGIGFAYLVPIDDSISEGNHNCKVDIKISTNAIEYKHYTSLPSLNFTIIDNDKASDVPLQPISEEPPDLNTDDMSLTNLINVIVSDREIPIINGELDEIINVNEDITLRGYTKPEAKVNFYVYSELKQYSVTSDESGYWELKINGLEPGEHRVELEIIDSNDDTLLYERQQVLAFVIADSSTENIINENNLEQVSQSYKFLVPILLLILLGIVIFIFISKGHPIKFIKHLVKH